MNPTEVEKQKISFNAYMRTMIDWLQRDPNPMLKIHNMLFPTRATRMKIDVLGDLFPETQITGQSTDNIE